MLVVDVQRGVVGKAFERERVVQNIVELVERARRERTPVVWVQHSDDNLEHGSEGWQLAEELSPTDGEPLVEKHHGDAFEGTNLEEVLAERNIGRLIVTGAATDACVRSTLHGGFVRGYDTLLVGDAHTTDDMTSWGAPPPEAVIAHTNLYWRYQTAPGKTAGVVETKEVTFG